MARLDAFRICQCEHGVDDSVRGARTWARLGSTVRGVAHYVGVCRRLARQLPPPGHGTSVPWLEGDDRVDGRLVAVGYTRVPPREWVRGDRRDGRQPRRLVDYVAYWQATQSRPTVIGSFRNADPETVYAFWAAGIPADQARQLPPPAWHAAVGRDGRVRLGRVLALSALCRRLRTEWVPRLSRRTVRALLRWDAATLRACGVSRLWRHGRVDWAVLRDTEHRLASAPVEAMQACRVSAGDWLEWASGDEQGRAIRAAIALRERGAYAVQPVLWATDVTRLAERILSAGAAHLAPLWGDLLYEPAANVLWTLRSAGEALAAALGEGHVPPPEACASVSHLREWLDAQGHHAGHAPAPERDHAAHAHHRALDRLAQRDPEWAEEQYLAEYERGQRLAPILRQVLAYVGAWAVSGSTVVIHGRDGELIYQLIRRDSRLSRASRRRVRYAITSRPLTTQAAQPSADYDAYLRRALPRRAVHVDTGFVGSIPQWCAAHGWSVECVALISAHDAEHQIPVEGVDSASLRETVLRDLEHSAQRLAVPRAWPPAYSHEAPGFWSRLYGACDALGLPRRASC